MIKKVIIFLVINFAALGLGGLFTGKLVNESWYLGLEKAPWTPPGWVFGAAWTLIMVCFAIYMAHLISIHADRKKIITLFAIQLVLNISWNPIFFHFHAVLFGLITISALTALITFFLFNFKKEMKSKSLLILPYFLWLLIATSLNAYILLNN